MARGPTRRSVALATLVACTALVGCSGFVGPTDSTEAVTPAPVPSETAAYPPGISAASVSPEGVAAAHARRLQSRNYTLVSRQRVVGPNGTMRTTERRREVAAGGDVYAGRFNRTVREFPHRTLAGRIDYWTNGSVYASRGLVDGTAEYYGWSRDDPDEDVDGSDVIARVFAATDPHVVSREDEAIVVASSRLVRPDRLPSPPYLTAPHNVSLTARVTDEGVVVRWRLAYDATVEDRPVRVVWTSGLTDVGATTVERPAWLPQARAWVDGQRAR
jgi:hypothetical protein